MIQGIFDGAQISINTLRELQLMHELTQMEGNDFTVKLLDIIMPVKKKADLFSFNDLLIVMTLVERDQPMSSVMRS